VRGVWIILIFAVGVAFGLVAARHNAPPDLSRPLVGGLWCPQPTVDLGQVWQTDDLAVPFELVNDDSARTFAVTLMGACRCTRVEPASLDLAPGERVTVVAHIDLEGGPGVSPVLGGFEEVVTAEGRTADGLVRFLTLEVRGVSQPAYEASRPFIEFADIVRGQEQEAAAEVRCFAGRPVEELEFVSVPEGFTARAQPLGRETFRVTARSSAALPYGEVDGRLRFRALTAQGPFVTGSVALRGAVVPDVQVVPTEVLLRPLPGQRAAATLTLSSRTGRAFEVVGVESVGNWLHISEEVSKAGGVTYNVAADPCGPGQLEGEVAFAVRGPEGGMYRFAVRVVCLCQGGA
jgi:hypothetical protein